YNHFEAFYRAIWFYGLAFLVLLLAHLRGSGRLLRNSGVAIAILALAFHATGIVMRCLIAGRPPVTNMYESIIWVSFAVSFFGMIVFCNSACCSSPLERFSAASGRIIPGAGSGVGIQKKLGH